MGSLIRAWFLNAGALDLVQADIFIANDTWTKHASAEWVTVIAIGGGGSGGGGQGAAEGATRGGGSGGGR